MTLLPSGNVLVCGGNNGTADLATVEIYTAATGIWATAGSMSSARSYHTATLLPNGKVLIAGGRNGAANLAGTELYDPDTNTWTTTGSMSAARNTHTATLLSNGRVLAVGGNNAAGIAVATAETFDPLLNAWTAVASPTYARDRHNATLLQNGKVIVSGGTANDSGAWVTTELYDAGLNVQSAWQPVIVTASAPSGSSLVLTGTGFQGVSEASGGSANNSATNYPLVLLRSLTNGQSAFVLSSSAVAWSGTGFTSQALPAFPEGFATATVFANGIPSKTAMILLVDPLPNYAPTILSPGTATFTVGAPSSFAVQANAKPTAAFTVTGSLPAGVTLNSTTGILSGTPAAGTVATYNLTITASNGIAPAATQPFTLTVQKGTAVVTLGNLSSPYTGFPVPATAMTVPPGLEVDFTYNPGGSNPPVFEGLYSVTGTVNDASYQGSSTGQMNIGKAAASVTLGNLHQTYTGNPVAVSALTNPPGLQVDLTYTYTSDGNLALPKNADTYTVVAVINDVSYQGGVTGTLVVDKAAATITLDNLNPSYTGSGISATATTIPSGLNVSYTYKGGTVQPEEVGTYDVAAQIQDANYTGSTSGTMNIAKAIAAIALTNLTQRYDGNPKIPDVSTTPLGLPVSLAYTLEPAGTPLNSAPSDPGTYTVNAQVTNPNYDGNASRVLTIVQTLPTLTFFSDTSAVRAHTPVAVPFSANVLAQQGSSTAVNEGSVTFTVTDISGTIIGSPVSGNVVGSSASATYMLPAEQAAGVYSAKAVYGGTENFLSSSKNALLTVTSPGTNPPSSSPDSYSVNEGQTLSVSAATGVLANDSDPNLPALPLSAVKLSDPVNGTLAFNSVDGSFTYTPNTTYFGTDSFTYRANNGSLQSPPTMVTITVLPVNQAPSFVKGPDQTIRADAGPQNVPGWATTISAGPANESGQALTFTVQNFSNSSLFLIAPKVSINGTIGTLSYVPDPSAGGQSTVNILLKDDGGTANGGVDSSTSQSFTITITQAPPVLPATLSASGMVNATFTYPLSANGAKPVTFTAASLPAGLSLSVDKIVGTPTAAGQSTATIGASNGVSPGDSRTMNLVIVDTLRIVTYAGSVPGPANGDGGPAASATLNQPAGAAVDKAGILYIADTANNRVRTVDAAGTITTVAGGGTQNADAIPALSAQLYGASAVAVDGNGNLFICEQTANRIRIVTLSNGQINTIALSGLTLSAPSGVAVDGNGNLYIADHGNRRIVKVDTNLTATMFAGGGNIAGMSGDGGLATAAHLNSPFGVAVDAAGNVYIADLGDQVVRKVDGAGNIRTVAGQFNVQGSTGDGGPAAAALLSNPQAVAVDDSGNFFIAVIGKHRFLEFIVVGTTTIVTLAVVTNLGGLSGDVGPSYNAKLNGPAGVAVSGSGNAIYIADRNNSRIRRLGPAQPPAFASPPSASLNPVEVKTNVVFSCLATGEPPPVLTWDFGDGTQDNSNTSTPTHTYNSHGAYTVKVTASTLLSAPVTASMIEVVKPATQIPLEFATALGFDPDDPNASPLGPDEPSKIFPFATLQVTSIKLNYKTSGKDSIGIVMSVPLHGSDAPAGQQLALEFGGRDAAGNRIGVVTIF